MNLASPWAVQIAMIPVRRPAPASDTPTDAPTKQPSKRHGARRAAEARRERSAKAVLILLRRNQDGLTIAQMREPTRMSNSGLMRVLRVLEGRGQVICEQPHRLRYLWRLAPKVHVPDPTTWEMAVGNLTRAPRKKTGSNPHTLAENIKWMRRITAAEGVVEWTVADLLEHGRSMSRLYAILAEMQAEALLVSRKVGRTTFWSWK